MYWEKEIIEGMKLIKKGCKKAHEDINKCDACPFNGFCDAIVLDHYRAPFAWRIKNEND